MPPAASTTASTTSSTARSASTVITSCSVGSGRSSTANWLSTMSTPMKCPVRPATRSPTTPGSTSRNTKVTPPASRSRSRYARVSAEQLTTIEQLLPTTSRTRRSHGSRSASSSGVPASILSMFARGCRSVRVDEAGSEPMGQPFPDRRLAGARDPHDHDSPHRHDPNVTAGHSERADSCVRPAQPIAASATSPSNPIRSVMWPLAGRLIVRPSRPVAIAACSCSPTLSGSP